MLVLEPTTRFALMDNITLQGISELDHYYVFNNNSGDHFQLNHTAHYVLECIGRGIIFQELIDNFAKAYELQVDIAKEDLSEILRNAIENHIIKEVIT